MNLKFSDQKNGFMKNGNFFGARRRKRRTFKGNQSQQ